MVRKTTRRGRRVLVLDFTFTKPDGTQGRYRRDASVQTAAAAQTEETARRMGATLFGDPEILCGPNGQPLRAAEATAPAPAEPTFADTVTRYFSEYAPSVLTPSTLDGYQSRLRTRVLPRLGELPLSTAFEIPRSREIDVAMVAEGVSQSVRHQTFLALRSVARFAVEGKLLSTLPPFLPLPKRGKHVPTAPAPAEVAALIDAAASPEHQLVILLAAHAGLRQGEIRALRCGDCELDKNRLVVRLSKYRSHTKLPKSGHEREVPLTAQLRAALLAAGVDQRPRDEAAARTSRGKPWGDHGPWTVFQATLQRLGLPPSRLHGLRAFFVTALLNGRVPAHVVRELVGHGDLATTQRYAAVVAADRGSAVTVLDDAYRGAQGGEERETKRPHRAGKARRPSTLLARLRRRRSAGNSPETGRADAA